VELGLDELARPAPSCGGGRGGRKRRPQMKDHHERAGEIS
jgi:hypothetical protein